MEAGLPLVRVKTGEAASGVQEVKKVQSKKKKKLTVGDLWSSIAELVGKRRLAGVGGGKRTSSRSVGEEAGHGMEEAGAQSATVLIKRRPQCFERPVWFS